MSGYVNPVFRPDFTDYAQPPQNRLAAGFNAIWPASNPVGTETTQGMQSATPTDQIAFMRPDGTPVMQSDLARAHAQVQTAMQVAPTMVLGMEGGSPFDRWFGKSKVVDEAGKPLVVYHQTATERMPSIYDQGFSTDPSVARARLSDEQVPNGIFFKPDRRDIGVGSHDPALTTQVPTHLAIQSPLVVADRDALQRFVESNSDEYARHATEMKSIDADYSKRFDQRWESLPRDRRATDDEMNAMDDLVKEWQAANVQKATVMRGIVDDVLRQKGHDGVVIENDAGSMGRKTKTYIALDPRQIKSATENRGTYDPYDPRITYGAGGLAAGTAAAGTQQQSQ